MLPMVVGQIIASISIALLAFKGMAPHAHEFVWVLTLAFTGLGIGTGVSVPYSVVQVIYPKAGDSRVAQVNGAVNFSGQFGGAMAVQIGQVLFLLAGGTTNIREAVQHAMYAALGAAAIALLAAFHVGRLRIRAVADLELPPDRIELEGEEPLTKEVVPEQPAPHSIALENHVSMDSFLRDSALERSEVSSNQITHMPVGGWQPVRYA